MYNFPRFQNDLVIVLNYHLAKCNGHAENRVLNRVGGKEELL